MSDAESAESVEEDSLCGAEEESLCSGEGLLSEIEVPGSTAMAR